MLRREPVSSGAIFQLTSDTEVIVHLIARSAERKRGLTMRLIDALMWIEGAYASGLLSDEKAHRHPRSAGHPPAGAGQARRRDYPVLGNLRARHHRRARPEGGRERRDRRHLEEGIESHKPFPPCPPPSLHFRRYLFRPPRSIMGGRCVYDVRKALWPRACPANLPPMRMWSFRRPDSGVPAAIG